MQRTNGVSMAFACAMLLVGGGACGGANADTKDDHLRTHVPRNLEQGDQDVMRDPGTTNRSAPADRHAMDRQDRHK